MKWVLLSILAWCLLSVPLGVIVGHWIWRCKHGR
jgi:hypothetical protein